LIGVIAKSSRQGFNQYTVDFPVLDVRYHAHEVAARVISASEAIVNIVVHHFIFARKILAQVLIQNFALVGNRLAFLAAILA
jgi:hypothetical protein